MSTATSITSQGERYRIKAPDYDPSSLPALPPKRTKEEREAADRKYAGLRPVRRASAPKVGLVHNGTTPPPATIPPPLPGRTNPIPAQQLAIEPSPAKQPTALARQAVMPPPLPGRQNQPREHSSPVQPAPRSIRADIAPPPQKRPSALSFGMNKSTNVPPPIPGARTGSAIQLDGANGAPPPIPSTSKPDLAAIQASKPKVSGTANGAAPALAGACMHCRDFSGPDNHAARFPREALPSQDIGWLAQQLCAPFHSPTDKARALFTWQHHNIAYDTEAFFNNRVKPSTPNSTLVSGLAVCEGYAGLFAAMALKAGLEAVVVSGHGKGFGYAPMKPGDSLPRYEAGHAWNAVKIDGGEWKLLDCCWGAGSVCPHKTPNFTKSFTPEWFSQSNNDFGLRHFPGEKAHQYRTDGRVMSWEEYIGGEGAACSALLYSGYIAEEGLLKPAFKPTDGKIVLAQQGPTVRFSFQKVCPHWDPVKNGNGPYYLYILVLESQSGAKGDKIPFDTNGEVWWCDVPTRDLGRPGQSVSICAVTDFDGGKGRGLTKQRFLERLGRCGMAWGGVGKWDLV
ncbi:unnamed protein product [Zymoseptoria tritici ST99CH_3D1]|nr:unnamed protein product [Zymoseptoria tritici ST99CH_3D1]